jgi:hypothetical protein
MFAPNVFVLQGVSNSQLAHMAHFRDNKTKDCWRGKKKPQSEKCDDGIQAARHYDQIKK